MLEVRTLTKYYGALPAIRDLSFQLRPGGVLGLTAAIEWVIASHPPALAWLMAIFVLAIKIVIRLRARLLAQPFGLRFEEEDPDALFAGFNLHER